MKANEIAQKFANGHECNFWLTARQSAWLFLQFQSETKGYVKSYRRDWARGYFTVGNDTFFWEAHEGKGGSAIFKCEKYVAPVEQKDPLKEWLKSKGHDFDALFRDDMALLMGFVREFDATRTA